MGRGGGQTWEHAVNTINNYWSSPAELGYFEKDEGGVPIGHDVLCEVRWSVPIGHDVLCVLRALY